MISRLWILDIDDAFCSIRRRPLRSLLSSLGIGIGVTALIAMLSISEGAKRKAMEKIASLGTDTLRIEDVNPARQAADRNMVNLSPGLTMADEDKVSAWLGSKGIIGAYEKNGEQLIATEQLSTTATVIGVTPAWFAAEKLQPGWGRFLDSLDMQAANNYTVVGADIASELQLQQGSTIKLGGIAATVIGTLKTRGRLLTEGTGLSSLDFDRLIVLPLSAVSASESHSRYRHLDGMVIRLTDRLEHNVTLAAEQLQNMLLYAHRSVWDFNLVVPYKLLSEARESQRTFSLVMGAIAGLSLLVGGIGVMNVMLANVSDQTREIGLRMSLGASRRRIIWLYLWNSMLLTLSGGAWGIGGGVVLAYLIQQYAGWDVAYSFSAIVLAPLSALVTGLIFGLHPAMRAAELDPAIALREA